MTVPPRHLAAVSDGSLRLTERIRLARSVLAHRHWCERCKPDADDAIAALDGASIEEISERRRGA